MTTPLSLTHRPGPDGSVVLKAVGEIDMTNTAQLASALDGTAGRMVIDLTEVEYLDSAGLSILFAHADRIELVTNTLLEPVLTVSGLADLTTVHGLDATDT